jgi:hypothetical protein
VRFAWRRGVEDARVIPVASGSEGEVESISEGGLPAEARVL